MCASLFLFNGFQDMVDGGLGRNELIYFAIIAIYSIDDGGAVVREINHVSIISNRISTMHIGNPLWCLDSEYSKTKLNRVKFGVRLVW